jgi:hypothetical protein
MASKPVSPLLTAFVRSEVNHFMATPRPCRFWLRRDADHLETETLRPRLHPWAMICTDMYNSNSVSCWMLRRTWLTLPLSCLVCLTSLYLIICAADRAACLEASLLLYCVLGPSKIMFTRSRRLDGTETSWHHWLNSSQSPQMSQSTAYCLVACKQW